MAHIVNKYVNLSQDMHACFFKLLFEECLSHISCVCFVCTLNSQVPLWPRFVLAAAAALIHFTQQTPNKMELAG